MQMALASDRRESMEFLHTDGSRKLTTQTSHWSSEPVLSFAPPVSFSRLPCLTELSLCIPPDYNTLSILNFQPTPKQIPLNASPRIVSHSEATLLHWPIKSLCFPFSRATFACSRRLTWERVTGRLDICGYVFMPFWWERLGLVFKAWCQMVGATCEAKEEREKKKKTSLTPRCQDQMRRHNPNHTHTHSRRHPILHLDHNFKRPLWEMFFRRSLRYAEVCYCWNINTNLLFIPLKGSNIPIYKGAALVPRPYTFSF